MVDWNKGLPAGYQKNIRLKTKICARGLDGVFDFEKQRKRKGLQKGEEKYADAKRAICDFSKKESRDERGRRETTTMKDISPIHSAALPKSSPVTPYVRKGDLAVSQEKHKCPSTYPTMPPTYPRILSLSPFFYLKTPTKNRSWFIVSARKE